jgi:hypothetical protein
MAQVVDQAAADADVDELKTSSVTTRNSSNPNLPSAVL